MPLAPSARAFLDNPFIKALKPVETLTVAEARGQYSRLMRAAPPGEAVAKVEDRAIPGPLGDIPVRIYTPAGAADNPLPIYAFFHGGGWVLGDLQSQDGECRTISNQVGCVVVSVDYRHAPEHKFPAPVHDAYAAVDWVARNAATLGGDPSRLAVGGTSSGANLAAAVTLLARDRGGPAIAYQVLNVPVMDHNFDTESYRANGQGYGFDRASLEWCWNHYLADSADGASPLASPLRATDLTGLPPAFVMTSEYDALRDEGRAYAERLRDAGIAVSYRENSGMLHLFHGPEARIALIDGLKSSLTSRRPDTQRVPS